MERPRSRLYQELITKSWWTLLFICLCLLAYDQAIKRKRVERLLLEEKLITLNDEQKRARTLQEELSLQTHSLHDENWIELALMRGLGLVPEGQTKVHFMEDES